jgi:cardiolipin synthase
MVPLPMDLLPVERGGDGQLFPGTLLAMRRHRAARHEVWLATYIFHTTVRPSGGRRAGAPRRGAACGCAWWSTASVPSRHVCRPLREQWLAWQRRGAGRCSARSTAGGRWLQPGQLRRLHQKLCVVDGELAFVGGINIIDDRNDLHHGQSPEPRLDFAVSLRGPAGAVGGAEHPGDVDAGRVRPRVARGSAGAGRAAPNRWLARAPVASPANPAVGRGSRSPGRVAATRCRLAFVVRDNLRQRRAIERSLRGRAARRAHAHRHRVPLLLPRSRCSAARFAAPRGAACRCGCCCRASSTTASRRWRPGAL